MAKEKIYDMDVNSKKYIKLQKKGNIGIPLKTALISGVLMLVFAFIGDVILDIDMLPLVYIFLLINIYSVIIYIINWVKFIKIGNSCIIKNNNEILILYGNTTKQLLNSANFGVMAGGIIAQSHSNVGKAVGVGISAVSALERNDISNNETSDTNEIPNMIIENIINDPKTLYDYYKDVKFIKKNKNYLYFNGNKNKDDGTIKNKNFKINRKIYKNIDDILN